MNKIAYASRTKTKRFGNVWRVRNVPGGGSWYSHDGISWWKMVKDSSGAYRKTAVDTNAYTILDGNARVIGYRKLERYADMLTNGAQEGD